ncbi:Transcription initiation factor IID subunit [Phaffia rhodozyma]|uniref:Transcription initiation factor TFIID subunit 13 n=1 Tax=Phaffia rhodozyma TaxID=264483 RepID=A0A0F7SGE4_PHARH|nr:Transcription initiation factor IID subunit [Phaffia rhodozyma]
MSTPYRPPLSYARPTPTPLTSASPTPYSLPSALLFRPPSQQNNSSIQSPLSRPSTPTGNNIYYQQSSAASSVTPGNAGGSLNGAGAGPAGTMSAQQRYYSRPPNSNLQSQPSLGVANKTWDRTIPSQRKKVEKEQPPGPFNNALRGMMYAFGDDPDPANDTVAVMEDLLGHFVQELCALPPPPQVIATSTTNARSQKITFQHIRGNLSSHPLSAPLLSRLDELAVLQNDIKSARKAMDPAANLFKLGGNNQGPGGSGGGIGPASGPGENVYT